jgi:GNAT superfamily N-acetyltransferase
MAVRSLNRSALSADDLAAIYEVMVQCHAEANAEEPYRSLAETEAYLRHPPGFEPRHYWLAERGGECQGFAQLGAVDGSPAGSAEILVRPDARRQGNGRELLAVVREQARLLGCRILIGSHGTAPGASFAAWARAVDTRRDVRSLLRLPCPAVAREITGSGVQSWVGATPDGLVESYAQAREAINDAPRAADEEWAAWDADRIRDLEAVLERRGRELRVTVALDAVGSVVAFTELRVSKTPGAMAGTEDTAVLPAHRRRGLGRWVKVESLRLLQRDRPDVHLVTTTNAEDNTAMLTLNRALGFRPVAHSTSCVLDL